MDNQNQDENNTSISGLFSGAAGGQAATPPAVEAPVEPAADAPKEPSEDELKKMLMTRARLMDIKFSNNITVEKLREKINAKLDGEPEQADEPEAEEEVDEPAPVAARPVEINALTGREPEKPRKAMTHAEIRAELQREQMKLVRLRITCMDPKKKDLQGEFFCIANEFLGTVKKFVPFGESTEEGFHVPYCIYTMMDERKFLNIRVRKDPRTQREIVESNYAKEFALEVLPPLTPAELAQLATAQKAAGSIDSLSAN